MDELYVLAVEARLDKNGKLTWENGGGKSHPHWGRRDLRPVIQKMKELLNQEQTLKWSQEKGRQAMLQDVNRKLKHCQKQIEEGGETHWRKGK